MANTDKPIQQLRLGPFVGQSEMAGGNQSNSIIVNPVNVNVFGNTGTVLQRNGLVLADATTGAAAWWKYYDFNKSNGNRYRIWYNANGDFFYNSAQTFVLGESFTIAGTGPTTGYTGGAAPKTHRPVGVVLNDLFLAGNWSSTGAVHKFDGSTWTALTAGAGTDQTSAFYRAKCALVEHDRVFVANIFEGSTLKGSTVRFSAAADGTSWTATDYILVNPDDGESIQQLISYQGSIVIFKDTAIYVLSGKSADSFALTRLTGEYGTRFGDTVAVAEDKIVFFDSRHGMVMFDGEKFSTLTLDDPNASISERLYYNSGSSYEKEVSHMFGWAWSHYYAISYPTAVATGVPVNNETAVLDVRSGLWTTWTLGVEFCKPSDKTPILLAVGCDLDGSSLAATKSYRMDLPIPYAGSASDEGSAVVAASFETGWIQTDDQSQFRLEKVEFDFWTRAATNTDKVEKLTVYYDTKQYSSTHTLTINVGAYDDWTHIVVEDSFQNAAIRRPKRVKLKFERGATPAASFGIKDIVLHVSGDKRQKEAV